MPSPLLVAKSDKTELALLPALANRHGLITGATGTGKTVTLQALAQRFSEIGVPVFVADVKGDLSGIAKAGGANAKVLERFKLLQLKPDFAACPVAFWDVFGKNGHPVRATVSDMGPLLLGRMLGLNETQEGVLTLVFKIADDNGLLLLDLKDLRAMLQHVGDNAAKYKTAYGNVSTASVGAIQRGLLALESQGAAQFFGEPMLDIADLMQAREGKGVVNILVADQLMNSPKLYSTFLLWLLAELFEVLPEVGDPEKPRLVFFFDEAHLLFEDASKQFKDQVEQVVRLVRSKGVGVFFVTQSPKDVPADILSQLGNRVQHALRAFTPDDEKALRAAARTFPKTGFYDVQATLQALGIGEALVTVLGGNGAPTPPFISRMVPPSSRMGPLTDAELAQRLAASEQVREYAVAIDRQSAREILAARIAQQATVQGRGVAQDAMMSPPAGRPAGDDAIAPARRGRAPKEPPTMMEQVLKSPVTRTVAGAITRGIMGALLGSPARRRRSWL